MAVTWQLQLLEAAVQDAGDGPGAVQWGGGDLPDDGVDVVPGELGGAEPLLEDWAGVFPLIPPGFGSGEAGFDLLIEARVQRLPDRGGPQGEQVAGFPACSWAWRICSVADRSASSRSRMALTTDSGDACCSRAPACRAASWTIARSVVLSWLASSSTSTSFSCSGTGRRSSPEPSILPRNSAMLYDSARPSLARTRAAFAAMASPTTRRPVNEVHIRANSAIVWLLPAPAAAASAVIAVVAVSIVITASRCPAFSPVCSTAARACSPGDKLRHRPFGGGEDLLFGVQVGQRAVPLLVRRPVDAAPVGGPHPQAGHVGDVRRGDLDDLGPGPAGDGQLGHLGDHRLGVGAWLEHRQMREVDSGSPVDLRDRVGVMPQRGRPAAAVAEASGGVAQVEAADQEQPAELDVRLLLGLGGGLEADLPLGNRIDPGVHPSAPRSARQLLYATFGDSRHGSR